MQMASSTTCRARAAQAATRTPPFRDLPMPPLLHYDLLACMCCNKIARVAFVLFSSSPLFFFLVIVAVVVFSFCSVVERRMLQRAASNAYSWWWASHIRTRQSKWLDNNLQEEKFRRDIDGLLEENLEFWMKFSTSFQKIQEFQTKHDQLQSMIGKLINEDKLKQNSGRENDPPAEAESEATEKRLRELKIELQVWLEQNDMFKGELQCRFASLCSIQEEIQEAMEMDAETEEGVRLTSYQAAKFTGEILNMKQENNKVADELQAGLNHIRGLQAEIEKFMPKILESTSLSGSKGSSAWRNAPSKSRVPLRSFQLRGF